MEEARQHRAHAPEVAGSRRALQTVCDGSGIDRDVRPAPREHLVDLRHERQVDALLLYELEVAVEVARVRGEVLVRPELQRVHEDRHDDDVALLAGPPHQGKVSLVEEPHGGHVPDGATGDPNGVGGHTDSVGGPNYLHDARTSSIRCRAGPSSLPAVDASASAAAVSSM